MILDCMEAHYYRSESDCWKFLWIQTTGPAIHGLFRVLTPKGIFYRHLHDTSFIHDLYRRLIPLIEAPTSLGNIDASELLEGFLYRLARLDITEENNTPYPSVIHHTLDYIREHLYEDVTVEGLASRANYSVCYFTRLFKKHLGISPYQYIINLRLHKAAGLLLTTDQSIEEIARRTSFSSVGRLAFYFRRRYGKTPLQYRKAHSGESQRFSDAGKMLNEKVVC